MLHLARGCLGEANSWAIRRLDSWPFSPPCGYLNSGSHRRRFFDVLGSTQPLVRNFTWNRAKSLNWNLLRASGTLSVGAVAGKNRPRRLHQNLQIQKWRPRSGIPQVQPNHLIKCCSAAPVHLPETCDSGLGFERPTTVPNIVDVKLITNGRPRSDQRHLTLQHIPELREFIHAGTTHEPADPGDARIVGDFVDGFRILSRRAVDLIFRR